MMASLTFEPVSFVDDKHVTLGPLHDGLGLAHGLAAVEAQVVRWLGEDDLAPREEAGLGQDGPVDLRHRGLASPFI